MNSMLEVALRETELERRVEVTREVTCLVAVWLKIEEKITEPMLPPTLLNVPIRPIATPRSRCGTWRLAVV